MGLASHGNPVTLPLYSYISCTALKESQSAQFSDVTNRELVRKAGGVERDSAYE